MGPALAVVLVIALVAALAYVLGSAAFGYFNGDSRSRRAEDKMLRNKAYLATKSLRLIASGQAGSPELEATAVLDEIEQLDIHSYREISR